MPRERLVLGIGFETSAQAPLQRPQLPHDPACIDGRYVVHEIRTGHAGRFDSLNPRLDRTLDGRCLVVDVRRQHRRIEPSLAETHRERLDHLEMPCLAHREHDPATAGRRWPRPPGLAVHVMNNISLLSNSEPSAEPCEHERHQHPRRGLHRDPAVLAEGPRHPLGRRRTGQQNDALRLDIVHHPLERRERLQHIEPEQDALGHRQQIREPDAVHREGRLRLASRPPRGDEPRPEFG